MSDTSRVSLGTGRGAQKLRTRRALLASARVLIARGEEVSVAAVAAAAGISKATAYRYFDNPDTLALEAALDVAFDPAEVVVGDEGETRARVHRVARYLFRKSAENERNFRLFLSRALAASVAPDAPTLRGARRLPMYELAVRPARAELGDEASAALVNALAGATGVEAYIALRDVCALQIAEAERIMTITVDAILDAFLKREIDVSG